MTDLMDKLPATLRELGNSREVKKQLHALEREGKVVKSMKKTEFGFEQVYRKRD